MEQIIKLTGRIAEVMPLQSGISQRTGNSWQSQEYLLEYFAWSGAQYANRIVGRVFGEENIAKFHLQQSEEVTLTLSFNASKSQDGSRYFNEVRITNVERAAAAQVANQPAQQANAQAAGSNATQQPQGAQQGAQQPAGTAPFPPASAGGDSNTDDLPF